MKKRINRIIHIVCFCLITVILMSYFSNVMLNGISADAGSRADVYQYIDAEDEDTIDILFIGDSALYSSVIPPKIWKDMNITSFSVSYGLMTPQEALNDLKYVLEKQSPKIVFFEPSLLLKYEEDKFDYGKNKLKKTVDYVNGSIEGAINNIAPLMRYKSEWSTRTFEDFLLSDTGEFVSTNKGYVYSDKVVPPDATESEPKWNVVFNNNGDVYFKKIVDLCNDKGVILSLISLPDKISWSQKKHDKVVQLSEKYDVNYVDFSFDTEKMTKGFSWNTDTQDGGSHLNYSGAVKITDSVENYIRSNYDIPKSKLSQKQKENWDNSVKEFYDKIGEE